jgi:Periplasmic copper-binding protein (NosD)
VVGPGNYAEQLTVNKDGISLVGQGAVLLPPTTPLTNECSGLAGPGTQTGICVVGTGVTLAPFVVEHRKVVSVDQPVTHVSVSGFQVRGFSGANIALVGAQDSQVTGNWLYDGGQYGALSDGSMDTIIADNAVIATGEILFIGICTDNVAGSEVSNNHVSGYYVGLCIQTPGADIHNNDVSNCCVGAAVDPNVKGATLQHNRFGPTNPACTLAGGAVGIYLSGSIDADVRYNLIEGQQLEGMAAGLGVVDDYSTGSAIVASGNVVVFNTLKDNDLDIYLNTTGTGNVVANNDCTTPAALCS